MPVTWDYPLQTSQVVLAAAPNFVALLVRKGFAPDDAQAFTDAVDQTIADSDGGVGLLLVYDPAADLPGIEAQTLLAEGLTLASDHCLGFCAVVPGRGFKTSSIRTTVRMLVVNSGIQAEIKIGGDMLSSLEWIGDRVCAGGTMLSAGDLIELLAEVGVSMF